MSILSYIAEGDLYIPIATPSVCSGFIQKTILYKDKIEIFYQLTHQASGGNSYSITVNRKVILLLQVDGLFQINQID